MEHIFLLLIALYAVVHGAQASTKYAEKLAEGFHVSRYLVGFIAVSAISIVPELFITINAAIQGKPEFGVGTLLGSNVADLTLIFAILIFTAGKKGFKVEKSTLRRLSLYPLFLLIPLILGLDGAFSREEGFVLVIIGLIFYTLTFRKSVGITSRAVDTAYRGRNLVKLIASLVVLLAGAHFTVMAATGLAEGIGINATLIGVLLVGLGTAIPELSFSLKAVRSKRPEMAIGDIFGSVLADATVVIGLLAIISPFTFPQRIAYIAGILMVFSSVMLLAFMKSQSRLSRHEAWALIGIWVVYVLLEIAFSH